MEVKSQSRRQQMAEKSVADAGAETPGMSPFWLRIINRLDKGWIQNVCDAIINPEKM